VRLPRFEVDLVDERPVLRPVGGLAGVDVYDKRIVNDNPEYFYHFNEYFEIGAIFRLLFFHQKADVLASIGLHDGLVGLLHQGRIQLLAVAIFAQVYGVISLQLVAVAMFVSSRPFFARATSKLSHKNDQ